MFGRLLSLLAAACAHVLPSQLDPPPTPIIEVDSAKPSLIPTDPDPSTNTTIVVTGKGFSLQGATAACRVQYPSKKWGWVDFNPNEKPVYGVSAHVLNDTALECVLPGVSSPAPGVIEVSMDGAHTWAGCRDGPNRTSICPFVEYRTLIEVSLGRRPYLSNETGTAELLLWPDREALIENGFNGESVHACGTLPGFGGRSLDWNVLPCTDVDLGRGTGAVAVPLNLPTLPSQFDGNITVRMTGLTSKIRRLMVAPADKLPPNSSLSVVDHHHRAIRYNGFLHVGVGFYCTIFNPAKHQPLDNVHPTEFGLYWLDLLGEQGITQVMFYQLPNYNDTTVLRMLDRAAERGIGMLWDLAGDIIVLLKEHNRTGEAWKTITRKIELVKDHPAILGWYTCDDECDHRGDVYTAIKKLDPFHAIYGAPATFNGWMFGEASGPWGLSLDVPMIENYGPDALSHSDTGTPENPGSDGCLRHGTLFDPIQNCPGFWLTIKSHYPAKMHTALAWMSAVAGDIPALMYFALEPPHYGTADQVGAVGAYSRRAQEMIPALLSDVTDDSSGRFLLETIQVQPFNGQAIIRAAGWMQPGVNGTYCAHIVVVNTDERPQVYKAFLPSSGKGAPFGNLTSVTHALPDDTYSIPLEQDCGQLGEGSGKKCFGETIGGYDSVLLRIGCAGARLQLGADEVLTSSRLPHMDVYV